MAYWFIRLGHAPELAIDHGIVSIGYGIKKDVTHLNSRSEIKNKLGSNGRVAGLVNQFVNGIELGDIIISPFGNNYKIGTITKIKCTVESFCERSEKIKEALANCPEDENSPHGIKPAVGVDWHIELPRLNFPSLLRNELEKYMPAAVNHLKLSGSSKVAMDNFIDFEKAKVIKDSQGSLPETDGLNEKYSVLQSSLATAEADEKTEDEKEKNKDWLFRASITSSITAIVTAVSTAFSAAFIMVLPNYLLIIFAFIFFALVYFILYIAFDENRKKKFFYACGQFKEAYYNYEKEVKDDSIK